MINLVEGNGDRADSTYIKLVDRNTIEGYRFSKGWSPRHKIFFAIKSNVPVDQLAVFDNDQPVEEEEGYGLIKVSLVLKKHHQMLFGKSGFHR